MHVYHTTQGHTFQTQSLEAYICLCFLNLRACKAQKHNTMQSTLLLFYYTPRAVTVTTRSFKIGKKRPQNFSLHEDIMKIISCF